MESITGRSGTGDEAAHQDHCALFHLRVSTGCSMSAEDEKPWGAERSQCRSKTRLWGTGTRQQSRDKAMGIRPGRAEMRPYRVETRPCGAEGTSVKNTRGTSSVMAWEGGNPTVPEVVRGQETPVGRFLSTLESGTHTSTGKREVRSSHKLRRQPGQDVVS